MDACPREQGSGPGRPRGSVHARTRRSDPPEAGDEVRSANQPRRPAGRAAGPGQETSQAKARAKARKAKAPKVVRPRLTERLAIRLASIDLRPHTLLSKVPFVVLVIGALGVGLGLTLWLSTDSAERSYKLSDARERARVLQEQKEALERDVREAQSAPALAESARKEGMIPTRDTAHLVQDPAVTGWSSERPSRPTASHRLRSTARFPNRASAAPATAGGAAGSPGPDAAGRRRSACAGARPGPRRCYALRTAPRRSAANTSRRCSTPARDARRLGQVPVWHPCRGCPFPGATAPIAGPAEVPVRWVDARPGAVPCPLAPGAASVHAPPPLPATAAPAPGNGEEFGPVAVPAPGAAR